MTISAKEIAKRPDRLFDQRRENSDFSIKIYRPHLFCAVQVLYLTKSVPRVRAAVSDDLRITESTAAKEVVSMQEWWREVREEWVEGRVLLVSHDGSMENDEINVWMDLNLVVPFFRVKLGDPNLTIGEMREMTFWHSISPSVG